MTGAAQTAASDTSRRRPKDRKQSIVDAAAGLFAERGFAAVGIDEIGAAVGVTGPAIYRHYPSKQDVLAAVLTTTADLVYDAIASAASSSEGQLVAAVEAAVRVSVEHPEYIATYLRERPRLTGEAANAASRRERQSGRLWRQVIQTRWPQLDRDRSAMRQQAVIGGLTAAVLGRREVPEPRFVELLSASALAVMRTGPQPERSAAAAAAAAADGPGAGAGRWKPKGTRREAILRTALELFAAHGYAGVGIDELGEAVGISGSGIYRHYTSKTQILIDAFDVAGQRVAVGVDDALRLAASASDALVRLSMSYATVALDSVALITVTEREGDAIPPDERPRLARRRRDVRDGWRVVVRESRPELAEPEVRLLVRTVFPLVNQAARAIEDRPELLDELAALARAHIVGVAVTDP
ncbi:MAG: helix-turn-helix domain-containing protein [Acidimicrobiales bacterium]